MKRVVRLFDLMEESLLVVCLLLIVVLAFVNVVLRNSGLGSLAWADTLLVNLVVWVAMLGGSVAVRRGENISIEIFGNLMKRQPWLSALSSLLSAAVALVLALAALRLIVIIEFPNHRELMPYVESWVPMLILPYGFAVMGLRFAGQGLAVLKRNP